MSLKIDLHTHSTASDGLFEPSELVRQAHEVGLNVLALTDHDSTDGLPEAAQAAQGYGIEFIPGIEINTSYQKKEIHMLGYFLEYERPAFQSVLQTLREAREKRGERMIQKLNEIGVSITWERVRELAHGSVGRPHVAMALQEAGYVKSIAEAFDRYIGNKGPGYVPRLQLTPEEAIHLIRSANGVPVMAHPYYFPGLPVLRERLPELIEAGLAGLETYYGDYTPEQVQEVRELADAYGLLTTGGTDYHGPNIHPTPLGSRQVPVETVAQLRTAYLAHRNPDPVAFVLPVSN